MPPAPIPRRFSLARCFRPSPRALSSWAAVFPEKAENLAAGDFFQEPKEGALALRRDGPVDWQRLKAVLEALAAHAVIEVAPARASLDGGDEMVVGLVELPVVVLVVDDRLAAIALAGAPSRDLQTDAVWARLEVPIGSVDAIAVRQQEVGGGQDGGRRRV